MMETMCGEVKEEFPGKSAICGGKDSVRDNLLWVKKSKENFDPQA